MPQHVKPISATEARALFAPLADAPALLLAVSGGPDSTALLWLAARWRKARRRGPRLFVATVDHGLRRESASEARAVKALAAALSLPHRTLRWRGDKPAAGLPAAARAARYELLVREARRAKASHILTAHTRDDQAETVLMRLARGSGVSGLAAMAFESDREGLTLARPFLDIPKARLEATLTRAGIDSVSDPSNADTRFTRPRLRALLAQEGLDAAALARLARRAARADAALERFADLAVAMLAVRDAARQQGGVDARLFAQLPEEIRLRLVLRALTVLGHEGPPRLGRAEALLAALDAALAAGAPRFRQTLAGATVTLSRGRIQVAPAPPRHSRRGASGPA